MIYLMIGLSIGTMIGHFGTKWYLRRLDKTMRYIRKVQRGGK